MGSSPDVVIIGSGIGDGTLAYRAYRLVQHDLSLTIFGTRRQGHQRKSPRAAR
jgi:hypothetical protein